MKGKKQQHENKNDWRDSRLSQKMCVLLFVVANKMVQPLPFSKNQTKGTESVVSRQLSRPLGVAWSYLRCQWYVAPRRLAPARVHSAAFLWAGPALSSMLYCT